MSEATAFRNDCDMADGKIRADQISKLGPGRRGVLSDTGKVLDVLSDGRAHLFLQIADVTGLPISELGKIIAVMAKSGQVKLHGKLEDSKALRVTVKSGQ